MKRVPIISSHEVDTGNEDESVVDISSYLEMQSDAQLAADKYHCVECKEGQEAETKIMSDLYFETRVLLGKRSGEAEEKDKEIDSLKDRIAELEQIFDLSYKADMRAIKMWRKGHPERNLTVPDKTDMVIWLLERLDKFDSTLQEEIVEHLSEIASLKSENEAIKQQITEICK